MIKALASTAYALSMLPKDFKICQWSPLILTNNWHLVLYKVEMSRTWVLLLNAYLYWTNKFMHGFINIYFNLIFTSYIRNPCSILKEYRRNFGHGFGLKNCSVYKLGYQLGILHFLSKNNLTWSPPTFYIFTINRLSVREMTLFGKKKKLAGGPLTLEVF